MSEIKKLIDRLCPDGVEYKKLGEIGTFTRGNGLQKKDFTDFGFPCIHYGQIYTRFGLFTDKTLSYCSSDLAAKLVKAKKGDMIIACTSENVEDVCKSVVWLGEGEIATGGHACVFSHNQDPKYVAYFFRSEHFFAQKKRYAKGVKVIDIKIGDLEKIEIPVPPIEVQSKIVEILDNFTELEIKLEAELEARRKQYEYYRNQLLTFDKVGGARFDVKWMTLGEIGEIGTGSSNTNEELEEGKYPFFVRSQIVRYKNDYEFDETAIITSGDGVGVGKVFHFVEGKYALHQRAYRIRINNKDVYPKFFFYYMRTNFYNYIMKNAYSSSVTSVRRPMLIKFPVPIPPLSEQERIVSILDRFEALTTDLQSGLPAELEARRKQYEYYREQLLTFKRKTA